MRLTRCNPIYGVNNRTYRIPFASSDEVFRTQSFLGDRAVLGLIADTLGAYEDLGTVEELKEMKQEFVRMRGDITNQSLPELVRVNPNKSELIRVNPNKSELEW